MADDRGWSLGSVGLAFLGGGLVGAAMALLLVPQSGGESREQLQGYARRVEEWLTEKAVRVLDQAVGTGRDFIRDKQAVQTEALEAERATMHRKREGETR